MPLTNPAIAAGKPGDVLRDDVVPGLHVRCFPERKSYYLFYRTKAGVQRRPKLGDHGVITLAQARALAKELLLKVAAGDDPVAERQEAKAALSFEELWPVYVQKHLKNPKRPRKARTIDDYQHAFDSHLKPRFGRKALPEITREAIEAMHTEMHATPVLANRVLSALSSFLTWAVREKRLPFNPCAGITKYPENKRERFMVEQEARTIAGLLADHEDSHPEAVAFIYLLILTGARPGEVAKIEPSMLRGDVVVLDEHKTDRTGEPRLIFLPPAAKRVIDRLPRTNKTLVGIKSPKALWEKIRVAAGCPDLRLYDLRHTFASAALAAGYSLDQVGLLLGHRSPVTTRRYTHLAEKFGRQMAADTAKLLEGQMQPLPAITAGQSA